LVEVAWADLSRSRNSLVARSSSDLSRRRTNAVKLARGRGRHEAFGEVLPYARGVPLQRIAPAAAAGAHDGLGADRHWKMAAGHGPEIALEPVLTPEQLQRGTRAVDDFKLYLRDLVARRSREQHLEEGEILSKLIAASELSPDGGSGERVTDLELLHNCIFILNAGHETTTSLIGNGVDFLIPIRTPCGSCARIPN
jgi:cytochrome P450